MVDTKKFFFEKSLIRHINIKSQIWISWKWKQVDNNQEIFSFFIHIGLWRVIKYR